jgi:hypothetical protein
MLDMILFYIFATVICIGTLLCGAVVWYLILKYKKKDWKKFFNGMLFGDVNE